MWKPDTNRIALSLNSLYQTEDNITLRMFFQSMKYILCVDWTQWKSGFMANTWNFTHKIFEQFYCIVRLLCSYSEPSPCSFVIFMLNSTATWHKSDKFENSKWNTSSKLQSLCDTFWIFKFEFKVWASTLEHTSFVYLYVLDSNWEDRRL
jgi:hypothetical protein